MLLQIPEPMWHCVILVKSRELFERWLQNPTEVECPIFVLSKINHQGKIETMLSREEIERLVNAGFKQVKIGLNCILY
ncbi:MAG: hypothetical protein EBV07_01590 [Proteobacteria bacterium]|nr:hypothetical protein [Pseudomonadota bacterium]